MQVKNKTGKKEVKIHVEVLERQALVIILKYSTPCTRKMLLFWKRCAALKWSETRKFEFFITRRLMQKQKYEIYDVYMKMFKNV